MQASKKQKQGELQLASEATEVADIYASGRPWPDDFQERIQKLFAGNLYPEVQDDHSTSRDKPASVRKRKRDKPSMEIPGTMCFSLDGVSHGNSEPSISKGRKGALSLEQKADAAQVRRVGACLRCKLQRRRCSGTRPCQRCIESSTSQSPQNLECFSLSLLDNNVFEKRTTGLRIQDSITDFPRLSVSVTNPNQLDFNTSVLWNIRALADDYVGWVKRSSFTFDASSPCVLSPKDYLQLASQTLGVDFCKDFRLLLWTTSLIFILKSDPSQGRSFPITYLRGINTQAGTSVLQKLDNLCRTDLRKKSDPERRALFLAVVGTSLAAMYSENKSVQSAEDDYQSAHVAVHNNQELQEMRSTLIRKLGYIAKYIGKLSGLFKENINIRVLVDVAENKWYKKGQYIWRPLQITYTPKSQGTEGESSSLMQSSDIDKTSETDAISPNASPDCERSIYIDPLGFVEPLVELEKCDNLCPTCHEVRIGKACLWCSFSKKCHAKLEGDCYLPLTNISGNR
ncbi:MAG: hypothetical protein M1834_002809 [Cirrosporium novae-zelandiae]|nr:MAG: hypothetical protein M1834_002809 [Cirrosporium novae-zelandiae]